jgi:hypothetical protein
MNIYVHLWTYLAHFLLEWGRIFRTKFAEKIKTHILGSITVFLKYFSQWDNMEEHGAAGQATNNNTIQRMRIACSVSNATNTQLELLLFNGNNGDVDAPHCCVRLTVPVLLFIVYVHSILFSSLFHPFLIFIILFYSCFLYPSYFFLIMSYFRLPFLL